MNHSRFGMMNWIYTWYKQQVDPGATLCPARSATSFWGELSLR
jgi:hypothetical protein